MHLTRVENSDTKRYVPLFGHTRYVPRGKNWKFYKLPETLTKNSVIPGNSRREFLGWRIPGNSRTGIPGGLARDAHSATVLARYIAIVSRPSVDTSVCPSVRDVDVPWAIAYRLD